jgi:hypothetical protein
MKAASTWTAIPTKKTKLAGQKTKKLLQRRCGSRKHEQVELKNSMNLLRERRDLQRHHYTILFLAPLDQREQFRRKRGRETPR